MTQLSVFTRASIPPPPQLREQERSAEYQKGCKMLSSGHDTTIANMILRQQRLSVRGVYKTEPVMSQSWIKTVHADKPHLAELWQLVNSGEEQSLSSIMCPKVNPVGLESWVEQNCTPVYNCTPIYTANTLRIRVRQVHVSLQTQWSV